MERAAPRWGNSSKQAPPPPPRRLNAATASKALPAEAGRRAQPLGRTPLNSATTRPTALQGGLRRVATTVASAGTAAPSFRPGRGPIGKSSSFAVPPSRAVSAGPRPPPSASSGAAASDLAALANAEPEGGVQASAAHVRVAVRVRPMLASEAVHARSRSCIAYPPGSHQFLTVGLGRSQRLFAFDHVFGEGASQRQVYGELVAPLLDHVLAGRNVGVLAYGQTGSGKTHSLLGSQADSGIVALRSPSGARGQSNLRAGSSGIGGRAAAINALRSPIRSGVPRAISNLSSPGGGGLRSASFAAPPSTSLGLTKAAPPALPPVPTSTAASDSTRSIAVTVDDSTGMLARFVVDLWARLEGASEQYSLRVTASMLELYGEEVLDLLADDVLAFLPVGAAATGAGDRPGSSTPRSRGGGGSGAPADVAFGEFFASSLRPLRAREPLSIREDRVRGTVVVGLRTVLVRSAAETFDVLTTGLRNRTTASTVLNDLSSRSHLVFFLQVDARNHAGNLAPGLTSPSRRASLAEEPSALRSSRSSVASGSAVEGGYSSLLEERLQLAWSSKIAFADLAGSERLTKTQAKGIEMKEGIGINSGLLALSNVIAALSSQAEAKHVPYRDSKLTRILADYLGGTAVTAFLACLNPCEEALDESIQTLRYADRAKHIRVDSSRLMGDATQVHVAHLRKHVSLLRLDTVMRHFQIPRREAIARLLAANKGADPEVDRFVQLLHAFVTGWGELFDGKHDVALLFSNFMRLPNTSPAVADTLVPSALSDGSKPENIRGNSSRSPPPPPRRQVSAVRTSDDAVSGAIANRVSGAEELHAISSDWPSSAELDTLNLQLAESAIHRYEQEQVSLVADLDANIATTMASLSLLESQAAALTDQLVLARISGSEPTWCQEALRRCEARRIQASGRLAFLQRSRDVLVQQRDQETSDHRVLLERLRSQQELHQHQLEPAAALLQVQEPGNTLQQLLHRLQSRQERRVHRSETEPQTNLAISIFDADIAARTRTLAAEYRLVFELTKRADLQRSLDEALRRRRAALAAVRAAADESGIDSGHALALSVSIESPSFADASPLVALASARLRLVEDEIEALDMRLGAVEQRVRDASEELRLVSSQKAPSMIGGNAGGTLGSDAHISAVAQGLSPIAARNLAEDLVLRLCDLSAQLRASRAQRAAAEHALDMAMRDADRLRCSLRDQHVHWAAQLVASQKEAAESELLLARAIATNGSASSDASSGSRAAKIAPALLRRMELLQIENGELKRQLEQQQQQQQQRQLPVTQQQQKQQLLHDLKLPQAESSPPAPAAFGASSSSFPALPPSPTGRPGTAESMEDAESARGGAASPLLLPDMIRVDSATSANSSGTTGAARPFLSQHSFGAEMAWPQPPPLTTLESVPPPPPKRHPFLSHCDAVLGCSDSSTAPTSLFDQQQALALVLFDRLGRASPLAVRANDLCSDLALDISAAVFGNSVPGKDAPLCMPNRHEMTPVFGALVSLFTILARVPARLLSPEAAAVIQGLRKSIFGVTSLRSTASRDSDRRSTSIYGSTAVAADFEDPQRGVLRASRGLAPIDTGNGSATTLVPPLGTPAEVKALVRARVRARDSGMLSTTASPVSASPPHPPSEWLADGSTDSRDVFLAFAALPAESLSLAALRDWEAAVSRLAVLRAHRRTMVDGVLRAVAGSGRLLLPLSHAKEERSACFRALSLACGLAEGGLPQALVYRLLEGLVAAYGDDAAAVTRVLDELRSWRNAIGWPDASEAQRAHSDRLDAGLWARLAARAAVVSSRGSAVGEVSLRSALTSEVSSLATCEGADLLGAVDETTMLHAVALALHVGGAAAAAAGEEVAMAPANDAAPFRRPPHDMKPVTSVEPELTLVPAARHDDAPLDMRELM